MGYPESVRQERGTRWSSSPPAGLLGLLAAPAIPRDTLLAGLADLPSSGVAPLLERLAFHRVDGLAFRALSRLPKGTVDPWLRAALKRRHQRCTAATLVQGMAMAEILHNLTSAGIRVAVLGGLRSVESIYGDAGSRPIEDHHLLVPLSDHDPAAAALRRLGFAAAGGDLFRRGGMLVDLHVDAVDSRRRTGRPIFPLPTERLMERASSGQVAGAPAMLLSPEDELLLLAIKTVRGSFGRLIDIADLAHLVAAQGCALDWDILQERAASSHTSRLLGLALKSTTVLGVAPPWDVKLRGSARWLERILLRRTRSFRPLPLGGGLLVALSAPGLAGGLCCLVDVLLPLPRPGLAPRRPRSTAAGRVVVAFRPDVTRHRHQEESVHGR
jgi:hypothetical protein